MRIELSIPFSTERIASLLQLPPPASAPAYIYAISTDSRELALDDLFVDLVGDILHQKQAAEKASLLLCPLGLDAPWKHKTLSVFDVRKAFLTLAATYGKYFPCQKIAVTGSVGKTTVKEYLSAVLGTSFRVQKSLGNYNNELGVAYTLFSLQPKTEFLIAEAGMNHKGELRQLSSALCPQDVILTNVKDAHLGNFNSQEELRDAKLEILEGMSENGRVLIGTDSPLLQNLRLPYKTASVGLKNADYMPKNVRLSKEGTRFDILTPTRELSGLFIPSFGKHCALSAAFAIAYAAQLEMNQESIQRGLSSFKAPPLRQELHKLPNGPSVLLDCYNASPASMYAAIDLLAELSVPPDGTPAVLLGGMNELGQHTEKAHRAVGAYVCQSGIQKLFAFGQFAPLYAQGALDAGMAERDVFLFEAPDGACANAILTHLSSNGTLLVKASRAEKAERILSELLKIQGL